MELGHFVADMKISARYQHLYIFTTFRIYYT